MDDDNKVGTLLPYSSMTAELFNAVADECVEHDAAGIEPKWWKAAQEECVKALRSGNMINVLTSAKAMLDDNNNNAASIGGTVLKMMAMGWRMAEIALQREIAKGVQ